MPHRLKLDGFSFYKTVLSIEMMRISFTVWIILASNLLQSKLYKFFDWFYFFIHKKRREMNEVKHQLPTQNPMLAFLFNWSTHNTHTDPQFATIVTVAVAAYWSLLIQILCYFLFTIAQWSTIPKWERKMKETGQKMCAAIFMTKFNSTIWWMWSD